MNGAKSLSDDLHEEVGGDFRVQGDGCREVTGGLNRLNGDVLRVDLNLGGERDGDLLCGDAAEQLAGLGDLGSDFNDGALDQTLGGNSLFAGGNGLGQTLKIGANKFRIVGVLAAKVSDPDMQQGSDDDCVYLPYTTAMRLSSQSTVNNYAAVMEDEGRANEAKSAVESELQRLLGSDNGYYVYSASEWLEEMNNMINMVIVILTGIASISLLVGGIGIMNIMLVSVTERTREIGIRKALGAKEHTILSQFVVEAATTSALGGALGIALGYIVSMGANKVLPMFTSGTTVTVSPSFNSIAVAFGISVGIGVLFGYLPAKRAARLNPIEALRYD